MSRDTWPDASGAHLLGDGRYATAARRPASVAELCEVVLEQADAKGAVYPQGGRSALDYGGPPARPGIAVDITGIDRIVDYPHADMTITVEAGITVAVLQSVLDERCQRLLFDVPCPDRATLGGALATGVCGPRRFGLGRPRDSIIGVSFVTSKGVEVKGGGRVVKNVAGYDFPKLLTGSMGSLGVITRATLKVRPKPEASALAWIAVESPDGLAARLEALNTSSVRPVAMEFLNPSASRDVGRASGLEPRGWTLIVGIEDDERSVAWQVDRYRAEVGGDFPVIRDEASRPLWAALTEFQSDPAPLACSASLRPSRVAAFLADLREDRWSLQAHAASGVVRMRGLGDWTEDEAVKAVTAARAVAVRDGGNLVVTQCPTAWKPRLHVWGESRADWAMGRAVKRALDPIGLMNPGRFVGDS